MHKECHSQLDGVLLEINYATSLYTYLHKECQSQLNEILFEWTKLHIHKECQMQFNGTLIEWIISIRTWINHFDTQKVSITVYAKNPNLLCLILQPSEPKAEQDAVHKYVRVPGKNLVIGKPAKFLSQWKVPEQLLWIKSLWKNVVNEKSLKNISQWKVPEQIWSMKRFWKIL